jgi:alcohol dehydrogenase class IV
MPQQAQTQDQREIVGRGASQSLVDVLNELQVRKLLLVTGRESYASCGAKDLFTELLAPFEVTTFDAFSPNIDIQDAIKGAELCRASGAEAIVAVGGGSPIDMAKCIAAFTAMPGSEEALVKGDAQLSSTVLPLVAIPTTGGTGSESTHFAVVYIEGSKYSLASPKLLPTTALVDAVFTDKLPPYITACSGFDALCQAVESFWSVGATDESQHFAAQAIELVVESLPAVVNKPNEALRDAMMLAANLAGKAINITKTTAPHALSYTITSRYGIPHGHAVALSLGAFFPFHDPDSKVSINESISLDEYASRFNALLQLLDAEDAAAAKKVWYQLMDACGLACDLGIGKADLDGAIDAIVAGVNLQRLANHPVQMTQAQLADLLRSVPWESAS